MAQNIIGLDIGSWSVKAMVLQSSLRRMALTELREHHLPTDAFGSPLVGETSSAVRAVLADLDADAVVAGVPGLQVLLREVELPFADEKSVTPVLAFRLDGLLPRPVETMVYDWHVLRKEPDRTQILCPAADKNWLEGWLREVRAGGAEPRQLTLTMLTAENLATHLASHDGAVAAEEAVALVDLGHRSSQVTLLRGGKVDAVRAISRGGHQVTLAIAKAFELAYPDAERMKHTALTLDPRAAQDPELRTLQRAAASALEPLLRELKMTLDSFRQRGASPSRLIVHGGTARMTGLIEVLADYLGVPVESPRVLGAIWNDVATDERVLEVGLPAAGLALEYVADAEFHRVNLRRGDMGSVSDFSALRARAGWIAAFLVALLAVFFVRKAMRISTLSDHEQQLAERLDEYAERVLGAKTDPTLPVMDRFDEVVETVLTRPEDETSQVYPQMTAFHLFFEVTRIQRSINDEANPPAADAPEEEDEDGNPLPPKPQEPTAPTPVAEKQMVELNSFSADVKSPTTAAATISGSGYDIVTIEKFAERLRQHACFKKVDRQETKKTNNPNRTGWTDFTIKVDVKCDLPGEEDVGRAETPRSTPADRTERAE